MKPTDIKPPFDEEKAKLKVKAAEIAWNMHDLWLKNYELANPSLSDH